MFGTDEVTCDGIGDRDIVGTGLELPTKWIALDAARPVKKLTKVKKMPRRFMVGKWAQV